MSTDYSSDDFVPTYVFGNMQDVHLNIQTALIKETTDPVNSNFCLLNNSGGQIITTPLQLNPSDGDPDDNTNNNSNINRVATRKWCKNAYITNIMDPHISSSDYTFTGAHVHSGDLRVTNDPTLANSVTRRSYVDTGDGNAIITANNTIRASANTWTGTNAFNVVLPTSSLTPSTGTQLITKTYADGAFQPKLTSASTVTMGDVDICGNTNLKTLHMSGNMSVNGTTITPTQLSYLNGVSSNIQTQIGGKQDTINSSSDITMHDLVCNNITCNAGTISYSEITLNDNALTIAKTSGLQTALDAKESITNVTAGLALKQDLITDGSLTIARTSGLQTVLDDLTDDISSGFALKQDIIGADDLTFSMVDGLQTALDDLADDISSGLALKQDIIGADDLTISMTNGLQTALDGKQATLSSSSNITTGTIDAQGLITANAHFTLPVTKNFNMNGNIICNGCTINPTELSYVDNVTSNIQTQIDSKQATLTNGSVSDSLLASTFVKTSTDQTITGVKTFSSAPVMSGASITSSTIPTSAIASGAFTCTSLSCTSETDSGNLTAGSISEKYTSIGNNGTSNNYTLDYSGQTACYILSTAPTANFTIRLNNCGTDISKNITFAVVYNTTGKWYADSITAYTDTSSQITLASSVPLYSGGTP
jgi:hypothetical protein